MLEKERQSSQAAGAPDTSRTLPQERRGRSYDGNGGRRRAHDGNGGRRRAQERNGGRHRQPADASDRGEARGPNDRWVLLALVGVALLYMVAQALVFSWGEYHVNRDEAIYLTQIMPGEVAHDMAHHRTRGMSLLALPIGPWAQSMVVLRAWMVLLGGAGLVVAFKPWIRTIGWAAPVSALVFAFYWVNFLFGAQLYPNFFAALGCIAVAGHFVRYLREERRGDLVAVGALLAFTALVRPLDSVLVAFALWVGMLVFSRRHFLPTTVAMALGGLAGFAPWLIEGWVRFDLLPWELLVEARESGASGQEGNNAAVYLNNTDGPFRCVEDCPDEALADGISVGRKEALVLLGYLGAALLGLVGKARAVAGRAMWFVAIAFALLLGYYLQCECAMNLRYLEPAFGFLALLIGSGIVRGWGIASRMPLVLGEGAKVLGVVLIVGWAVYQGQLATEHVEEGFGSRERAYLVSQEINERADPPCAVASAVSDRQIHFYSDCITVSLNQDDDGMLQYKIGGTTSVFDLGLLSEAGYQIYAVGRPRHIPDSSPVWDWEAHDISSEQLGEYRLFEAPEGVEIETEYADGYSPEDAGPP